MTFDPGTRVVFMKVGTHAGEDLPSIIERKRAEISAAGFALWGYGGNTCHPRTMVNPFVEASDGPIVLAMHSMDSRHFADPVRAEDYSSNGIDWQPIPEAIDVRGSRFALAIRSLEEVDEVLDLAATRVAEGNCRGRLGSDYIRGHVDKACLVVESPARDAVVMPFKINLTAQLAAPYAVYLRN